MRQTARTDLHLHLDGSLNLAWAYRKAIERGVIPGDMTFEEFYDKAYALNTQKREESIKKFQLMCDVLQTREDLHEATYNLVELLHDRGIYYAEIRFASQQHTNKGLTQAEALEAVISGAQDAVKALGDIRIGIINCLMHKGESAMANFEENMETVRVTKQYLGKGAVGIDLAGFENNCDYMEYAPVIAKAKEEGIPVTMHAGEMGIGRHVVEAIDMGADRLGHGVECTQDPEYLKRVLDLNIPLEVCVSSNVKKTLNYAAHQVRFLIEKGANVTINTDNMVFARTDTLHEHFMLRMIGVTEEQLIHCTFNAARAAFCDEDTRAWLIDKLKADFPEEYEKEQF